MKKIYIIFIMIIVIAVTVSGCKEKEEQMNVEEIYRIGLSRYLLDTLDLNKYDEALSDSEMKYIPNTDEIKNEFQKMDKLELTYIYLRNELHIDRLTEEETNILKKEAENMKSNSLSDEAMNVIINTFPDVISAKEIKNPKDTEVKTMYDNNGILVEVNAIVFRIGTQSEFDENGNYVNKKYEVEKQRALKKFSNLMEENLNGKLGKIPIRIQLDFSPFSEDDN